MQDGVIIDLKRLHVVESVINNFEAFGTCSDGP